MLNIKKKMSGSNMDIQEALQLVDAALHHKMARHIKEAEAVIVEGIWQGQTYARMANSSRYLCNYLQGTVAPDLYMYLGLAVDKKVNKSNLRQIVENDLKKLYGGGVKLATSSEEDDLGLANSNTNLEKEIGEEIPYRDWENSPDVSLFQGRTAELDTLTKWITEDKTRLIVVSGMAGIGKTFLAKKLAAEIEQEFEVVIWRSLSQLPTLDNLLAELLSVFRYRVPEKEEKKIEQLMKILKARPCLLVLDGLEAMWAERELVGSYREGYSNYQELIATVAQRNHQSCLLITSQAKPKEIVPLVGENGPVRIFPLTGLDDSAAAKIFEDYQLEDKYTWQKLNQKLYSGNPHYLKVVADTIKELYEGQVSQFLELNTLAFGEIHLQLKKQFDSLSKLEKSILYELALVGKPVSSKSLINILAGDANMLLNLERGSWIEALNSLIRRSLLEKTEEDKATCYSLGNLWQEFMNRIMFESIYKGEIEPIIAEPNKIEAKINILRSHLIVKIDRVHHPVIESIIANIMLLFNHNQELAQKKLAEIVATLEEKQQTSSIALEYALENLHNLGQLVRSN